LSYNSKDVWKEYFAGISKNLARYKSEINFVKHQNNYAGQAMMSNITKNFDITLKNDITLIAVF